MKREYFNPPELGPTPMNIYNHVVKVGNTAYIAGQVPRDRDGNAMHPGDPVAQIRVVWSNLKIAVEAAGGRLEDIVKTTTYVVGETTGAEIRAARVQMLPEHGRPTSTTVAVAGLADPDFLVEVEAIAIISDA